MFVFLLLFMFNTLRQLTAASFIFPQQLPTDEHFRLLHMFLSQTKYVNNKFQTLDYLKGKKKRKNVV